MSKAFFNDIFSEGREFLNNWQPGAGMGHLVAPFDVLDFFCCAGGASLGFACLPAYFHILGGIDIDSIALQSYQKNFNTPVLQKDITSVQVGELKSHFGITDRPLVLIGCAPCQGFSTHRKRYHDIGEDERNTLIGSFAEIAVELNPAYVVMENVPEILRGKYISHYEEARAVFESHGYRVFQRIYNAAGMGVPQSRQRAIIVATRSLSYQLPEEWLSSNEYVTVRQAIGQLPPVASGALPATGDDPLHVCSRHKESTLAVIRQVPHDGGFRPKGVGPRCLDRVKGFSDVYGRLSWDKPSVTITRYARNPASGRFSHPEQDRGLTVREVARIQSFPDGFAWCGNPGKCFHQIGEAVPPLLSLAIASSIAEDIKFSINACI